MLSAFGAIWVTDAMGARLIRVDPASGQVTGSWPTSPRPCELTSDEKHLWVTTQSGVVDRVDPQTGGILARIATGPTSYQTLVAFGAVWVTNRDGPSLTRIDPATGQARTVTMDGIKPGGIVAEGGALWVGDDTTGAHAIARVDPSTLARTTVEVGGNRPAYLTATPGKVWVSSFGNGTVVGWDVAGSRALPPVPAGASPVNLKASPDGRWVWVPDDATNLLTRVDVRSGEAVERIEVGAGPAVVAGTTDGVWVTCYKDGSLWHLTLGS